MAQGYWAVFTAIIVMQASLGGSFGAALDYFVGTLAGAVYGVAIALIVPRDNFAMLCLALVLALAPLALLAAIRRNFRVAPITAAIVLLIPATQRRGVFDPAIDSAYSAYMSSTSPADACKNISEFQRLMLQKHDVMPMVASTSEFFSKNFTPYTVAWQILRTGT